MLDFFIMCNAMCHCEEQSRGYIVKAIRRWRDEPTAVILLTQ